MWQKVSICVTNAQKQKEGGRMFSGTNINNIDSKGRVVLPVRFREELGETFYVTSGFDKCIQILSVDEFEHLREQIKVLPADKALALQYILISPAQLVSINKQGRISIPQALREDASLKDEVVIVGMDTRVEIWDKDTFAEFIRKQKQETVKEALELLRL